jgi:hypothetical protein
MNLQSTKGYSKESQLHKISTKSSQETEDFKGIKSK